MKQTDGVGIQHWTGGEDKLTLRANEASEQSKQFSDLRAPVENAE